MTSRTAFSSSSSSSLILQILPFYLTEPCHDLTHGLNNIIKRILPKRLFYRSLIIVATPIILLQIIITIVFFDSLWIKANKGMTRSLVGEVQTMFDIYKKDDENDQQMIINLYSKNFDFVIAFKENELLPKQKAERWFSPIDRSLRRELKPVFDSYWFDTTSYKELVDLRIKYKNGALQIFFPRNKIAPSSARIFALWITLPGFFLILIALIFLKNQTRPLVNLAKAAEKFGKGEFIKEFRPSGAREIRQAAYEFDRMRKRITIHLNQRSEMLSGISHDLRTPLTRLKLQLALLKQQDIAKKMNLETKASKPFSRLDHSEVEIPTPLISRLFNLDKDDVTMYKGDDGYIIAQVTKIGSLGSFSEEDLEQVNLQIQKSISKDLITGYAEVLRKRYKIQIYDRLIDDLI